MNSSLISVIVACYKQVEYLPEALNSVLLQSYTNWECIIVNDGSPDSTEEVAYQFCKMDSRFKYIRQENSGISAARNAGINISSGVYILPLDADDKIGVDYLKEAAYILDNEPAMKVVYSDVELIGAQKGIWQLSPYSLSQLALENMIYCSALFRRADFDLYGGYDESFIYGSEDWEFWLRILKKGGGVKKLSSVHFYYRKKGNSRSDLLDKNKNWQIEMRNKLFLKHFDFYTYLFGDPIVAFSERRFFKKQAQEYYEKIKLLEKNRFDVIKNALIGAIRSLKNKR